MNILLFRKSSAFFNASLKGSLKLEYECGGPSDRYYTLRTPFGMFGYCKPGGCEEEGCQVCCPHDERDHYICLDCGHEGDPGADIDAAMDYFEGLAE